MRDTLSKKSSQVGPQPPKYPGNAARQRESSTPELPPMPKLSPGPAPAPRVPRSSPGRRFSDSEKLAFGRRTCWKGQGLASSSKGNSRCSSAAVSTTASTAASTGVSSVAESCAASLGTSNAPSPRAQRDFEQGQLKRVLDRLLPVNGASWSPISDLTASESSPVHTRPKEHTQQQDSPNNPELEIETDVQRDTLRCAANSCAAETTFGSLPPLPATPPQRAKQAVVACTPLPAYGVSTPGPSTPGVYTDISRRALDGSADNLECFSTPACGSTQLPHQIPGGSGSTQDRRGRRGVLQQLRRHLLEHFRSVYDAISRLENTVPRERGLALREFRLAMERLGVEEKLAEEVFGALSSGDLSSKVSFADVRHALVEDSPEALLWELRCHLLSMGIQPRCTAQAIRKAVDLVQLHPEKSTAPEYRIQRAMQSVKRMRQKRRRQSCGARYVATSIGATSSATGTDAESTSRQDSSANTHLDRDDWHRFGSCLDLTAFEIDALFTVLGGDDVGQVDLRGMFVVLRATVAPDVSLERFVTRVFAKYGSLRCAFEAVCAERQDRLMRWPEFRDLAESLDVNDRNATNLWDVLSAMKPEDSWPGSPVAATISPTSDDARTPQGRSSKNETDNSSGRGISEDLFEQQLLVWAPGTALDALRDQICEKFGSLAQGRRVLQRCALMLQRAFLQGGKEGAHFDSPIRPGLATLTAMSLNAILQAAGITFGETDRVIAAAAVAHDGSVTLDSLMDVLRATQLRQNHLSNHSSAKSTLRDDTFPLWQRLHAVQADLAVGARKHDRRDVSDPIDLAMVAKAAAESPAPRRFASYAAPRTSPPCRRKAISPGVASPQRLKGQASPPPKRVPRAQSKRQSVGPSCSPPQRQTPRNRTPRNPFAPLYHAVASAVRSVSRRTSRGSSSKDRVHILEPGEVSGVDRGIEQ